MKIMTPEKARENQSRYRGRQRNKGMGLVNKWIPRAIREDLYDIIDKINNDFDSDNIDFVKFAIAFLDAQDGTIITAKKSHGRWRFILKDPAN